jgi:hypothetical protein
MMGGRGCIRPGIPPGRHGAFANTLTLTDVYSSWTENRATWGKGSTAVIEALEDIETALPFAIHTLKFDSGSEFMNYAMITSTRQTVTRPHPIRVVRSRPYKKDDNCYVEQENLTHMRELIGYDRIDVAECASALNEIYRDYWNPLANFFLPALKLLRKTRIGSHLKKEYDAPRTPYERVLECPDLSEQAKAILRARYERLDPFTLREALDRKLKLLFETLRRKSGSVRRAA